MRWLLALLACVSLSVAQVDELPPTAAGTVKPVDPTPAGDGHLGNLPSGASAQLRFALPKVKPLRFQLSFANVVGFSGRGTSYQLVVRRDSPTGSIVHEGPVIANGDAWNGANAESVDLTAAITDADCTAGHLDLFITPRTTDDGWTLYKDQDARPIRAHLTEDTPEARAARDRGEQLRRRGVSVLPTPQSIALEAGDLRLSARSRIVLPAGADAQDRFAANDLAEVIAETAKLKLAVVTGRAADGDISLSRGQAPAGHGPEAYRLVVGNRIEATAASAAGLFCAAATIGQLVSAAGQAPHCRVEDWPAFPLRGIQYDVARGQTVEPAWWERVIKILARAKLNAIMIYGENDYAFRQFPFLGRPGTFTPEKAKRLSDFARRYHVQLIPQFEALGHASAVLSAKELEPLREAGGHWVFCTSKPETWAFLDRIFGELCEQFPDSKYLHVGADEFEMGFGKCPQCAAKVAKDGLGGLYAEHMNKLNELCRKHHRTMLFWPSHAGPTDELSFMTVKYQDKLQKDCIPTEWIYHGPPAYPELEQYQKLGYQDVWASAAVVCFSRIWPDYPTTYRGVRGFLADGAKRGIKGAMTTTWEWMQGGLVANSMLGLLWCAECSWSLGNCAVSDFEQRYAKLLHGADCAEREVRQALATPFTNKGPGAVLNDPNLMTKLAFAPLAELRRSYAQRVPQLADARPVLAEADAAVARAVALRQKATRNVDLLDYSVASLQLIRSGLVRLAALETAAKAYRDANRQLAQPAEAAKLLRAAADAVAALQQQAEFVSVYQRAVGAMGAYAGDADLLAKQAEQPVALAKQLRGLADEVEQGRRKALPAATTLGLSYGAAALLGRWAPDKMSETGATLRFEVKPEHLRGRSVQVEWEYVSGQHGLRIQATRLLKNGQPVSEDKHSGWAGSGSNGNVYELEVGTVDRAAKYEIAGDVTSHGGTDSAGNVWLSSDE